MVGLNIDIWKPLKSAHSLVVFAMTVVFLFSLVGCGNTVGMPDQTETEQEQITTAAATEALPPPPPRRLSGN